jgi:hypothetical protein
MMVVELSQISLFRASTATKFTMRRSHKDTSNGVRNFMKKVRSDTNKMASVSGLKIPYNIYYSELVIVIY